MRLAAQTKLGFFPAHPDAVAGMLRHLQLAPAPTQADKTGGDFQILDPCAGQGLALKAIGGTLGVEAKGHYAIELDAGRADTCREQLPEGATVLGPASFMGTRIRSQSFGLVYCNPPFDNELGGGSRQEETFARRATALIKHGGILLMVVPQTAIAGNRSFCQFLDSQYEDIGVYEFPEEHRHYKEIAIFAKRRKGDVPVDYNGTMYLMFGSYGYYNREPVLSSLSGDDRQKWTIPRAWAPSFFDKIQMTEDEMVDAVEGSPLLRSLEPPSTVEKRRPPLPLYKGHVALLLASGMLDGPIHPPGEMPHVVRGTARKVDYLAESNESVNPDTGNVTKKEVWSQKIVLTVRAVAADGQIKTFEDGAKEAGKPVSQPKYDVQTSEDKWGVLACIRNAKGDVLHTTYRLPNKEKALLVAQKWIQENIKPEVA